MNRIDKILFHVFTLVLTPILCMTITGSALYIYIRHNELLGTILFNVACLLALIIFVAIFVNFVIVGIINDIRRNKHAKEKR